MSSFRELGKNELRDIVRQTRSSDEFLPKEDMRRFKIAVEAGDEDFLGTTQRYTLRYFYRAGEFKVFIQPLYGYAPCGSFDVKELLRGE